MWNFVVDHDVFVIVTRVTRVKRSLARVLATLLLLVDDVPVRKVDLFVIRVVAIVVVGFSKAAQS